MRSVMLSGCGLQAMCGPPRSQQAVAEPGSKAVSRLACCIVRHMDSDGQLCKWQSVAWSLE